MANSVWLEFADGTYLFHLKNKRIDEVERVTGAGLGDIYARAMTGAYRDTDDEWVIMPMEAKWKNAELVEVVRQGFIGGAKAVIDGDERKVESFHVNHLLQSYLEDRPRVELWKLAVAGLHATMEGYESPGEAEAPEQGAGQNGQAYSDPMDTPDI